MTTAPADRAFRAAANAVSTGISNWVNNTSQSGITVGGAESAALAPGATTMVFSPPANTDLPSVLKSLHVQQRFALLAAELQGADDATLHARFGQFLEQVRPEDTAAPTQPPGVIRSDGIRLVNHKAVISKQVAI